MTRISPFVVMMHGITAAGKTTTSKFLAHVFSAERIATSETRAKIGAGTDMKGRNRTYKKVARRLKKRIKSKRCFVLDGTYARRVWRRRIYKVCGKAGVPLYAVHCVCDDEVEISHRISHRFRRSPRSPDSEASDWTFYVTEKLHLQQISADDFSLGKPVSVITFDTYSGRINVMELSGRTAHRKKRSSPQSAGERLVSELAALHRILGGTKESGDG